MKITAIKTFVARFGNRPRALIKVETDEGIHGWGEAYSTGPDLSVKPYWSLSFCACSAVCLPSLPPKP